MERLERLHYEDIATIRWQFHPRLPTTAICTSLPFPPTGSGPRDSASWRLLQGFPHHFLQAYINFSPSLAIISLGHGLRREALDTCQHMWWNHQINAITEERALRDARAAQQAAEVGAAHISPLLTVTNVLPRFDVTEIIVICAGEEQKEYLVHRSVLKTSSSKFLNRMLSNDWRETREKRLSLPETRP